MLTALDLLEEVLGAPVKAGAPRRRVAGGGFTAAARRRRCRARRCRFVGVRRGGADSLQLLRSEADGRRTLPDCRSRRAARRRGGGGVAAAGDAPPRPSPRRRASHCPLVGDGVPPPPRCGPPRPKGRSDSYRLRARPPPPTAPLTSTRSLMRTRPRRCSRRRPTAAGGAAGSEHLVWRALRAFYGAKAELMRALGGGGALATGHPRPAPTDAVGRAWCCRRRRRRHVAARGSRDARVG